MTELFKDDGFQFATEIALGSTYYRCADVGEVLATAAEIKNGDFDSWTDAWLATAERVASIAERSEDAGHPVSAREAWQRASNYFDKAASYVVGTKAPERWTPVWRRHRDCFERAAALHDPPFQRIAITYEDTELEGWFFPAPDAGAGDSRPLLIMNNGSDGTVLDMFIQGAAAANDRGWHCLTFDGPGQGQALHEQGMLFRPDWEKVITPVVDYALLRPDVDGDRIALVGVSQGGYWVPRSVAYEHRIAAAVADPGVVDVSTAMTDHLPKSSRKHLEEGDREKFNRDMKWGQRFSKQARLTIAFRGRPYGAGSDDPYKMFASALEYKLDRETISRIQCPMLITDPESEQFWPGQSRELYEALASPKELVGFTAAEGGDSHCEPKAGALRSQRIFDWLDEVVLADTRG